MRIPSGVTDQVIYFVAVDATDLKTRETGLSSFTVYRSRDGGAATAYTTPTVTEVSSATMPGVYKLLLDEDMTIASGNDSEEVVLHITSTGMAPVTRTFELYRSKITMGFVPSIPELIDLADTATYRATILILNCADNLPSTAEITAGTVSIHRKASGATSWTAVVTDAALSEQAGAVYYDEVFDAGTGYAGGDFIRWTFKSISVTDSGNTFELCDANGVYFYSTIVKTVSVPTAGEVADAVWDETRAAHVTAGSFGELQADLENGGRLDLLIDGIKAKTDQLTFTFTNTIDANVKRINSVAITGDGQIGTEFSV